MGLGLFENLASAVLTCMAREVLVRDKLGRME